MHALLPPRFPNHGLFLLFSSTVTSIDVSSPIYDERIFPAEMPIDSALHPTIITSSNSNT